MKRKQFEKHSGLIAALFTPVFLGMNPVFGKLALRNGADPFTIAAVRTLMAAALLWLIYRLFARQYLYIYPLGLMNCIAIGSVNGIGSLMYYNGLHLLDASMAQLINALYLVFVMILTRISGQQLGWRTLLRTGIAMTGILLIAGGVAGTTNWLGIGLMMGNALLFAGTVVMSQRALYDMPAQTVAFYVLATMAAVVSVARLAYNLPFFPHPPTNGNIDAWWAIVGLATTTALSRLLMFLGVKGLGSVRTTLLVVLEMAVSITLSFVFLDERFTAIQWWGAGILLASILLPTERITPQGSPTEYLPRLVRVRLYQVAFNHVFNPEKGKISTQEVEKLRELIAKDKFATQDMRIIDDMLDREDPGEN
ncbi:MAG: DMT family transporter [Chloroflexi bacterium]|nr:DMT family transporter [Chloroflexota bacterium]